MKSNSDHSMPSDLRHTGSRAHSFSSWSTTTQGLTPPGGDHAEPPEAPPSHQGCRFFISYAHGRVDDENLARYLHGKLTGAGHQVFLDIGMKVGTDWAKEIDTWLRASDFLVVLLSERTLHSEMVLAEVRKAQFFQKSQGSPEILPVRMDYAEPLPYELRKRIAHLQFIRWRRPKDSQSTLEAILAAAGDERRNYSSLPSPNSSALEAAPSSIQDSQLVIGGPLRHDDPRYVRRRPIDHVVERLAAARGETLIFCGARQMGRTTLLYKYLALCVEHRKTISRVDFSSFVEADLSSFPNLLRRIAMHIQRPLTIDPPIPSMDSPMDLAWHLEDQVLRRIDNSLVIAFDCSEELTETDFQGHFFDMLRSWSCFRAQPFSPWEDVDLALVVPDDVELSMPDPFKSPLHNLGHKISVGPFQVDHYESLNASYGDLLKIHEIADLFFLLNGHPHLTMHAFGLLQRGELSLETLLDRADSESGPFIDHLRSLHFRISGDAALLEEMSHVIQFGKSTDESLFLRLSALGLVQREGSRTDPANALYARYFSRIYG